MKDILMRSAVALCALLVLAPSGEAPAQGYDTPLTVQGLDRSVIHSVASQAAGGITIGIQGDASLMFSLPAALQSLERIQVTLGSGRRYARTEQVQQYAPLKYYSNFSLLMEGLTGGIPDPDSVGPNPNAGDTVQRPYDDIGPNWSRSRDHGLPVQAFIAVPFSLGDMKLVAGAGTAVYADLNHHYQNNNVLTPSILSQRPLPILRPPNDSLPVRAQWSQYARARDGEIRGYGVALAGEIPESGLSLGVSAMLLDGTSDDFEQRIERGHLTFYTSFFRLDSVYGRLRRTGTSAFKGAEFTFSGVYHTRALTLGFAVRPPTTITRTYDGVVSVEAAGISTSTPVTGSDRLKLPWRGTLGLAIAVMPNVTAGLEYELRPFASAVYRAEGGAETNPWLSASVLHAGIAYSPLPWLALRAGVRGQTEVFEPEGNPIPGEPVSASVYSAGIGVLVEGVRLNLAYEYGLTKYQDVWGSAVSLNTARQNMLAAEIVLHVP